AGTLGSFVVSASCTFTSPLSMLTDLIKPNETMSRLKPGYRTDLSASLTSPSLIAIDESYRADSWSKDIGSGYTFEPSAGRRRWAQRLACDVTRIATETVAHFI